LTLQNVALDGKSGLGCTKFAVATRQMCLLM